ncbi:hypothetical protein PMAYCL1PPCAC_26878, partial [Pristionchus mayeri]
KSMDNFRLALDVTRNSIATNLAHSISVAGDGEQLQAPMLYEELEAKYKEALTQAGVYLKHIEDKNGENRELASKIEELRERVIDFERLLDEERKQHSETTEKYEDLELRQQGETRRIKELTEKLDLSMNQLEEEREGRKRDQER